MRFDLSGCGAGLDESAKDLLELGPFAERLGYDGLWINEEHFGQGSRVCFSPILVATALAMRTRTIRIGFSVLVLPLFEPIRLAEEIATLDVLSEGRGDLGVSRGRRTVTALAVAQFTELREQIIDRGDIPIPQPARCADSDVEVLPDAQLGEDAPVPRARNRSRRERPGVATSR